MNSNGAIYLEKALAIDGWMSPVELKILALLAQKSKFILEVGAYKGRSTRALIDNTHGVVVAVDPWEGPYRMDDGGILFDCRNSLNDFIQNVHGTAVIMIKRTYRNFIKEYHDTYGPRSNFDFIFIDGDHRYEEVKHDIIESLPLLKVGGTLAGHDYNQKDWPGVTRAVDEILPTKRIIDSIWITQKS